MDNVTLLHYVYNSPYQNSPISHLYLEEPLPSLQHDVVHILVRLTRNISFLWEVYYSDTLHNYKLTYRYQLDKLSWRIN